MPPSTSTPSGITLTAASVTITGKTILPPLTLSLTERRIGIVGRNGSGKTTFLRLIAGLIPPTEGAVSVDGIDPSGDRKGLIARLGILFQNPDHQIIFPIVEEELSFGLRQMGIPADEALAAARARLQIENRLHWAKAPVASLSQGQRHYLCLLAVLLMNPGTILLDEPFSGLDIPTTTQLRRHLDGLPQRLITISHDPVALAGYDRVIWLEGGRIMADGGAPATLAAYVAAMEREGGGDAGPDIGG
jgi:biotin transport system ATP-binding protein